MDLLDFEGQDLYFDEPLQQETRSCIDQAAERYGDEAAESLLLRAYFLEPQHPMVLVALYRFFYYQHRYEEALSIAEKAIRVSAKMMGLTLSWERISEQYLGQGVFVSMGLICFYMLALKGS